MFDMSFFKSFNKQVGDLRSQVDQLTKAIADKQGEINYLRTAPAPKSDVLAALGTVFDARAESARAMITKSMEQWHKRPLALADGTQIGQRLHVLNAAAPGYAPTSFSMECALLAVIGQQIEAGVSKMIDEMPWPACGPAIAARPAMIEKAERELDELTKQLDELRRQTADAGLLI